MRRNPRSRRGGDAKARQAFSTGQAARYCYVTADTILNWINGGTLPAHRTAGGQYRILAGDLLAFMRAHGMSRELFESEVDVRPYCWEFHCQGESDPVCLECLVYRGRAFDCWQLRGVAPSGRRLNPSCEDCDYHRCHAEGAEEE